MTTSFYTPGKSVLQNAHKCAHCSGLIEAGAKFCGQCGVHNSFSDDVLQAHAQSSLQPAIAGAGAETVAPQTSAFERMQLGGQTPAFARAHYENASPKVIAEIRSIMSALARERTILLVNTVVLVCVNLFGFWLSMKCYTEFIGDDVAKFIIALVPFLFVNCVGCVAMIPIRGTKREIYRLNEKLKVLKATMDYGHLWK